MPNTATDPATSHSPFPSLSANGSRECAERSPLQPLPVIARLDRAIQYSRDASDRAEKPRRTGRLHSWAMTQRTWHAPSGSLRAQRSNPSSRAKGGMDCFVARAPRNDVERDAPSHPRGTNARGLNVVPLDEREQGTPGARCTHGLVCKVAQRKAHTSIQVQRRQSGIPCAMVLRLMPCSCVRKTCQNVRTGGSHQPPVAGSEPDRAQRP
jgi:hypothetical protein